MQTELPQIGLQRRSPLLDKLRLKSAEILLGGKLNPYCPEHVSKYFVQAIVKVEEVAIALLEYPVLLGATLYDTGYLNIIYLDGDREEEVENKIVIPNRNSVMRDKDSVMTDKDSVMRYKGSVMRYKGSVMRYKGSVMKNREGVVRD